MANSRSVRLVRGCRLGSPLRRRAQRAAPGATIDSRTASPQYPLAAHGSARNPRREQRRPTPGHTNTSLAAMGSIPVRITEWTSYTDSDVVALRAVYCRGAVATRFGGVTVGSALAGR